MRRIFFASLLAVALFALDAAAQQPQPQPQGQKRVTMEDVLAIRGVGAPQWSPDGKWLAFTISDWNRKENRRDSHVYLVSADGGEVIRLTNGERGETQPAWSPDGRWIAFLANRSAPAAGGATPAAGGGNQIWIIPVRGGEAEKLTEEDAGVSQFRWSPDSRRIAYVVRDTPQDKAERDKLKKDRFDAIVVDSGFIYSHLWTIELGTKTKRRVTEGAFSASDPQWSSDSRWIAYVAARAGAQESSFTDISEDRNTDIFIAPAEGGKPRQLTTNPGPDSQPRFSPDGRWVAYTSHPDPSVWAQKTDLLVVATEGGTPRNLTEGQSDSVSGPARWSRDGRDLYVAASVGVYGQLLRVPAAGGEARAVFEKAGGYSGVDLSPDNTRLAFLFEDARQPEDIWVSTAAGRDARRITDLNPQAKEFALGDIEVLRWKGADNLEIEGMLVKPAGYERGMKYPTILQIHGGPYARFAYGFEGRAQIYAGHGYAVLMPNPRGSTGYGHKFATANVRDWGGKDFQDLMAGVGEVVRLGVADPDRLAVMGGSYGGFMTFWAITQTDRFKAAIGHAGISDWYSFFGQSDIPGLMEYGFGGTPWAARETYERWSPVRFADRVKTPLLITHGEQDRRVPIAKAEQYYRALRRRGVPVTFVRYPRAGHSITEPNHLIDLMRRHVEWFDKYLRPAAGRTTATTANQ
ncbi:MAG TPA: S9 family peptidase [Pyrinomonadaceae bacterium]|nr:S9 family peptidase [Pyrinomonadaceae bacterium]